jgi:hypothetical protein
MNNYVEILRLQTDWSVLYRKYQCFGSSKMLSRRLANENPEEIIVFLKQKQLANRI